MINPFNRDEDDIYEAKHQCMIRNNVRIISDDFLRKNKILQFLEEVKIS